jgi:hypothetical protein
MWRTWSRNTEGEGQDQLNFWEKNGEYQAKNKIILYFWGTFWAICPYRLGLCKKLGGEYLMLKLL